jgi:sulfite exporter TauE/SafE
MTELLQDLLNNSNLPIVTAFLLGLLTAISPCPLATNITAIGFLSKNIENRRRVFLNGMFYTVGRMLSYTLLGIVIIGILNQGSSIFHIQKKLATIGDVILGPALLLVGLFMLFGHLIKLPKIGLSFSGEKLSKKGGLGALVLGSLLALTFCPTSAVLYFGGLIPLSVSVSAGWMLAIVYAIATALPVLIAAIILTFSVGSVGKFYGKTQQFQKWVNRIVGVLFSIVGAYYCIIIFLYN